MTDSNHTPNQSPNGSPDYEGSDRDVPDREKEGSRLGVSTVQVGASAAAAVTSALAASFFGVAGTLIGAAVGSIISTLAGALYADYLRRAAERIKLTRSVVIQRIPAPVLSTAPQRRPTRPTDLPGRESMQPIGDERNDETVVVPVQDASELRLRPEGMENLIQSGASRAGSNGAGTHGRPSHQPGWSTGKKSALALAAISGAGFLIALGVVLVTETALGHPVSGGTSGTTISNIGKTDTKTEITPTEEATPTEAPTDAETSEPSPSETSDEKVVPTQPGDATETGGADSNDQPTAESTDPAAAATDAAAEGAEGAAEPQDALEVAPDVTEAP